MQRLIRVRAGEPGAIERRTPGLGTSHTELTDYSGVMCVLSSQLFYEFCCKRVRKEVVRLDSLKFRLVTGMMSEVDAFTFKGTGGCCI